ncbi:hypothetical protein OHC33_007971 [Knufia fluminis]|uniref:Uncharacterized protein n=1 Tax=Knufia fluminis TaxID=191047 RepID=A0AAN8I5B2_9EURO|nr:hypothetical protein OHC33_007971 [Knufia fluminis]
MNNSVAAVPIAGVVTSDVDNYDWTDLASFKSAREETHATPQSSGTSPKTPTPTPTGASTEPRFKRGTQVPESFDEIGMRLSNEFSPVVERSADTLVYFGVPPPTPGQDPYEYDYTERLFKRPYLMNSTTLRAVGSSKFEKFLGPMSARTERKLKKREVHKSVMQPANIKYYLDLSPITDGDEALVQLTELTVPQSALKWHQVAKTLGIPASHVGGRDELNVPPKQTYALQVQEEPFEEEKELNKSKKLVRGAREEVKDERRGSDIQPSHPAPAAELPLEEEYSALRHHTATARLLQALAGNDPKLNSAAKAWTFCMIAKYFDCAHSPTVSHWIVSWLLESGNSHFIQNNPEVAYRMAIATKSTWLIRCTFAVLVGQQAMIEGIKDLPSKENGQVKTFRASHAVSCLDDDDINRIDHAASALTRRVRDVLDEIAVFPGIWNVEASPNSSISKLNRFDFDDSEQQSLLRKIKDELKDYARRMIYMTLSPAYDVESVKGIGPFKGFGEFGIYTDIPQPLRLLTQHFWNILRLEQFTRDYTDTPENRRIWERTQHELKQQGIITGAEVPYVSRNVLFGSLDELNQFLVSPAGKSKLQPMIHVRPTTPEASNPTKKLKMSQEATMHGRSPSGDMTTLVHKMNGSSIESEAIAQESDSEFSGSWEKAAESVDEDEEWQDAMEAIHVFPVKSLSIRQKSMAAAPQLTTDTSEPTPFGTDEKIHYARTVQTIAPASTARPELSDTMASGDLVSQRNLSTLYYGDSAEASDEAVSPTTVPKRERTLQPNESPFLNGFSDKSLPDREAASLRFSQKRMSKLHPADDNARSMEIQSSMQQTGLVDPFTSAGPPPPPPRSSPRLQPEQTRPENRTPAPIDPNPRPITPAALLDDISKNIYNRLATLVTPGYVLDETCNLDIPNGEINTLLCLNDNEWKYLPLWAGGLDDGTGGVFNDGVEVPDAPDVEDGGFRGGAMGIIPGVGSSIGGSMDGDGSDFEEIMTEVGVSTVGKASRIATDGTATETVISMDE